MEARVRRVTLEVKPSNVYFSQEYIENRFEDRELIGNKLDKLVAGVEKISDVRTIRVKYVHGRLYTLDNRRLWVFRNYEKIGLQSYRNTFIPVLVWDDFESQNQLIFAANNSGNDVRIHNDLLPGGQTYNRVDSICASTYSTPSRLAVYDFTKFTLKSSKAVATFLWKSVSGLYGYLRRREEDMDL